VAASSMRISLAVPPHWPVSEASDGSARVIIPGHAEVPDLWLQHGPLRPLPLDPRRWVQTAPLRVESPTQIAAIEHSEATHTALGWPLWLAQVQVSLRDPQATRITQGDAAMSTQVCLRLHALYQFLEYSGEVVVIATSVERWRLHREALLAVLRSAQPDFRGPDVVALSELWAPHQAESSRR